MNSCCVKIAHCLVIDNDTEWNVLYGLTCSLFSKRWVKHEAGVWIFDLKTPLVVAVQLESNEPQEENECKP